MSTYRRIPAPCLGFCVLLCLAASVAAAPKCVLRLSLDGEKSLRSVGGTVLGGEWTQGRSGQAWCSRGGDDRIVIPTMNRFVRETGTIEMFFKVDAPNVEEGALILFDCLGKPNWWNRYCGPVKWAKGQASASFVIVSNKDVQFACNASAVSPVSIQPGQWHHYAATWRGVGGGSDGEMRLFLDGVEVARLCDQGLPVTNLGEALWLGNARHGGARPKQPNAVALDDVRVWDGVLPAHQIARHAAAMAEENAVDLLNAPVSSLAIRPVIEPPQIDGKVDDKTWQYAQCLTGFRDYHKANGPLVPLQATVWLAYDKDNLYAAWRCQMAADKPVGDVRAQDGAVFNDESMELLFLSPAKPDTLFHFIGNAYGSIYDEKLITGGQRDRKWTGPWEYRHNFVPAKYWEGELRIPLSDLGLSAPKPGELWRVNLARNGFEPQYQSVWSHTTKSYADTAALAKMTIAGPGPVVSGITFPELVVGENRLDLRYASTTKEARPLSVQCLAEADKGAMIHTAWRRLPDNTTARTDATRLAAPKEGLNRVALRIVDETDGTVVLHQPWRSRRCHRST